MPCRTCPTARPSVAWAIVWILGDHRIVCGDARAEDAYRSLLGTDQAQMVFTDPPFNVRIDGHVGGLGKVKHREFAMASGEMSRTEFVAFLKTVFCAHGRGLSRRRASSSPASTGRHLHDMLEAGHAVFDELKNIVCWAKTNGGMGSFYRSQHELIPVWKRGTAPHINNIELGAHGRYRTNVWTYAGANTFRRGRDGGPRRSPHGEALRPGDGRDQGLLQAPVASSSTPSAAAAPR